jgi:hypothetical protein
LYLYRPQQCTCEKRGDRLCYVAGGGCDLRSSDSYVVSGRYMRWMLNQLINGRAGTFHSHYFAVKTPFN